MVQNKQWSGGPDQRWRGRNVRSDSEEEEVKDERKTHANKTNERTWRTNKNPPPAEKSDRYWWRLNENFYLVQPAEKAAWLLTWSRY